MYLGWAPVSGTSVTLYPACFSSLMVLAIEQCEVGAGGKRKPHAQMCMWLKGMIVGINCLETARYVRVPVAPRYSLGFVEPTQTWFACRSSMSVLRRMKIGQMFP